MSIRYKIMIILLFLVLLTHMISMTIYYNYSLRAIEKEAVKSLKTMADVQKERLNTFINTNFEKLKLLNSREQLKEFLKEYNQSYNDNDLKLIKKTLLDAVKKADSIEDIFVMSLDGEKLISTNNKTSNYISQNHEMFFEDMNKPVVHYLIDKKDIKATKILFSTPIKFGDELLGIIIMKVSMNSLNNYLRDYTGLGMSGEVLMAVDYNQNEMLFFTPLRFRKSPMLVKKGSKTAKPMILALQQIETIVDNALDYRNEPVVAVTRYLDSLGFGIVVKMDKVEALNASRDFKIVFLELFIVLVFLVVGASIFISNMITNPIIKITESAIIISQGNYKKRIKASSNDELGTLAFALNGMAETLINTNQILEEKVRKRTEELHKMNRKLEMLSQTDPLTGIANRGKFDEHIVQVYRRSKRYRRNISLIIIDIDHFKAVNDSYGHQTGDAYLKKVVEILKKIANRADDLPARYGGEEFALVLEDTGLEGAKSISERIRQGIMDLKLKNCSSEVCGYLTVSLGIATVIPNGNIELADFIKTADDALYEAKDKGRNQIVAKLL